MVVKNFEIYFFICIHYILLLRAIRRQDKVNFHLNLTNRSWYVVFVHRHHSTHLPLAWERNTHNCKFTYNGRVTPKNMNNTLFGLPFDLLCCWCWCLWITNVVRTWALYSWNLKIITEVCFYWIELRCNNHIPSFSKSAGFRHFNIYLPFSIYQNKGYVDILMYTRTLQFW